MIHHASMHPCYMPDRRRRRPGFDRTAARFIDKHPALWPLEAHARAHRYARRLRPDGAPAPTPGQALVVAVRGDAGEVWGIDVGHAPSGEVGEFVQDAISAWEDAVCALPRNLPVLWTSSAGYTARPPRASSVHAHNRSGHATLAGRSFGLTFALALASKLVGVALPVDVIATATVSDSGVLGRVDGLRAKLEAVLSVAPRIRRVLVAREQQEEAIALVTELGARDLLVVRGYERLGQAYDACFPSLARHLVERGRDEARRVEIVDAFFRLTLIDRHYVSSWRPIATAAGLAAESWRDSLTKDQMQRLAFARAVAKRHYEEAGELFLPDAAWLESFSPPLRIKLLAHVVQQAASTGSPDPVKLVELAERYLPDASDRFAPHLELLGALGRLKATVFGDLLGALELQHQACQGWAAMFDYGQMTYPLSAMYLHTRALASVDRASADAWFSRAEAHAHELTRSRGDARHNPYVRLNRGRALGALGRAARAFELLEPLCDDTTLAPDARCSAMRIYCGLGESGRREQLREALLVLADSNEPASVYARLMELDEALVVEDLPRLKELVAAISALRPELTAAVFEPLGSRAVSALVRAQWLASRYPY